MYDRGLLEAMLDPTGSGSGSLFLAEALRTRLYCVSSNLVAEGGDFRVSSESVAEASR